MIILNNNDKPTNTKKNIALGMVHAALSHYKKFKRPVRDVVLHPRYWELFLEGLMYINDKLPDAERKDIDPIVDHVHFRNCTVKKGSKMMTKQMMVILKDKVHEEVSAKEKYLLEQEVKNRKPTDPSPTADPIDHEQEEKKRRGRK